jgi:hypothetical protein
VVSNVSLSFLVASSLALMIATGLTWRSMGARLLCGFIFQLFVPRPVSSTLMDSCQSLNIIMSMTITGLRMTAHGPFVSLG